MRVVLDGTPLLGPQTGIARYTRGLLGGLLALPDPPEVGLFTVASAGPAAVGAATGLPAAGRRVPARPLHRAWEHVPWPTLEALGVRGADVAHATNFVLPPSRRTPGVVSVHDLHAARHPDDVPRAVRPFGRLVRRALDRGALAVTLTETMRAEVRDFFDLPDHRVRTVRPGVGPQWSAAAPSVPPGLPAEFLLYVGGLGERKGVDVVRAALARGGVGLPLVVSSPDPLPPGPGLVDAGYVEEAALPGLVAAAQALVLPSRHEGLGFTALEALAAGTPVVCSDLPVLREVCGSAATFVPPGDVDAWAVALAAPPDPDDGRAERRAQAAPWTWRRCADEALAAYRSALADR